MTFHDIGDIFQFLGAEFPSLSAEFPFSGRRILGGLFKAPLQFLSAKFRLLSVEFRYFSVEFAFCEHGILEGLLNVYGQVCTGNLKFKIIGLAAPQL